MRIAVIGIVATMAITVLAIVVSEVNFLHGDDISLLDRILSCPFLSIWEYRRRVRVFANPVGNLVLFFAF
jgi:hypothetical protein